MLLALLAATVLPAPAVAIGPADLDGPPVRLWMNSSREYHPGEAVRVQVEAGVNGYLFVLRVDPEGMVRVLFPVRPNDDAFVAGGRRYEVRDDNQAQSFIAAETGPGYVWAAVAPAPWRFEAVTVDGTWDYGRLRLSPDASDPEAELTDLAQRIAPASGFDYDVLDYVVLGSSRRMAYDGPPPPGWWSPTYYGYWYDDWDDYRYRYGYDCFNCGRYRSGAYVSIGLGPSWYWPSYWYRPWYYGYNTLHPYYPPYWGRDYGRSFRGPVTVRPADRPVVVGRPRDYAVERRNPFDGRSRPGVDGREAGPSGNLSPARDDRPPARRARPRPADDGSNRGTAQRGGSSADRGSGGDRGGSSAQPSNGGSSGSPPARSRPRGDRPSSGSSIELTDRSSLATRTEAPFVERSRPSSDRPEYVRLPVDARSPEARPVDRTNWPVDAGRSRAESVRNVDRTRPSARPVNVGADRGSVSRSNPGARESNRVRAQPAREVSRPSSAAVARRSGNQASRPPARPAPQKAAAARPSGGGASAGKAAPAKAGKGRSRPRNN